MARTKKNRKKTVQECVPDTFKSILRDGGKITIPIELRIERGYHVGDILTLEVKSVHRPKKEGVNGQGA